ncbi:MAG: hypothetical protein ACO236_00010 [Candidatus Nanopelagicaceae bacterium]
MALQFRRGTEDEREQPEFVPLLGEPVYTTDTKRLYIGDGTTPGGNPVGFNNKLSDLQDVELISEVSIPISSISADNGVVSIVTTLPHGLETGHFLYLYSTSKPQINGVHEVTVTGISSVTIEASVANFLSTDDTGALKYEPQDKAILAWDQETGKWGEQTYVYRLADLGDVRIQSPQENDIIQYKSIPIGNITDEEDQIVETGVEEPASLAEGLAWTQTGTISRFKNKPFEIGLSNLTDVLINESNLSNRQILAYDTFLDYWRPTDYVDELTDLADVELTELPDLTEVQARVTLGGLWNALDSLSVSIAGTVYSFALTQQQVDTAQSDSTTSEEFNNALRAIVGNGVAESINANTNAPVTASFANNIITLNPKATPVNLNLVATVYNHSENDSRVPTVTQFEPVNSQVLTYDGEKWTNKPLEINNFDLTVLNDVNLDNVQNGQILQYNSTVEKWVNVPNFISLNQFADVEIVSPENGQALIYDQEAQKFEARSFILDDLTDVNDPSFEFSIPDGSILAYSEAEQAWKPQQFTTLSSRVEVSFDSGPIENLGVSYATFDAFTGYAIFKAKATAPCTLTLYVSNYERELDADRAENEDPAAGRGIFAEFTFTDTTYRRIAPVIYGFNDDVPIKKRAYGKIRNRSGYYQSNIQVTLTILQIESDPEQVSETGQ